MLPQSLKIGLALAVLAASLSASAQTTLDPMTAVPDPASVVMPDLAFTATAEDEGTFDKYYYFHRADTRFTEALADLRECDGYASGLTSGYRYQDAPYPYSGTMAGAAGGIIANALMAAIFIPAEKRRVRRINMRRCMGYKEYARFGLSKDLWQKFNFEEGFSGEAEERRQAMIAQQAKVASSSVPTTRALGL